MKPIYALLFPILLLVPTSSTTPLENENTPVGITAQRRPGRRWDISRQQEIAVANGLKWLAEHQVLPAGHWPAHVGYKVQNGYGIWHQNVAHIGVTALALTSFLAAGHLPGRGKYGKNLTAGLDYVLAQVKDDGSIEHNGSRMYSHAFAALFLAEIYGMQKNNRVRRKLRLATRFIVDSQNNEGGWRYRPKADRSDISVTVCQVMALRAARNVGIQVPYSVIKSALGYVRRSAVNKQDARYSYAHSGYKGGRVETGGFKYQLNTGGTPHRVTFPLTAAGVTILLGAGNYDDPLVKKGLDYLRRNEGFVNDDPGHYFFYYGHYYAAQAFFTCGDRERWRQYFKKVRRIILGNQHQDGSWPNTTGPGRVFGTAAATLILEIPYGYLPIFQR